MEQMMEQAAGRPGIERQRVEAMVETLANLRNHGETVAEVAHDARNMVAALGLYCDLLEEPGVLMAQFSHYGSELRLVAAASRRLVEKLVEIDQRSTFGGANSDSFLAFPGFLGTDTSIAAAAKTQFSSRPLSKSSSKHAMHWDPMPAEPIDNFAAELEANRNLLASLAGSAISLTTDIDGGARRVRLTGEDLTRILINLVKNACEALHASGRIEIGLNELRKDGAAWLALTIADNGPGIPAENLERVFASGFTAPAAGAAKGSWPSTHRGLGLAITRSIVGKAGGSISAANREYGGAQFTIQLPVTE